MLNLLKTKSESEKIAAEIAELEQQIEQKDTEGKEASERARDIDQRKNGYKVGRVPREILARLVEFQEQAKHAAAEKVRLERAKSKKREAWIAATKRESERAILDETSSLDQQLAELQQRRKALEQRVQNLTEQRTAVTRSANDLQKQLSEAEQAHAQAEREAILNEKKPKSDKALEELSTAHRAEKSKLSPLNREIKILEDEIDKIKSEEREIDQRLCEREYLLLKSEFEEAGKPLLEAETAFCNEVRELVRRWQALREHARACGKPFHGAIQPFPHRIGQHATDTAFTFGSGRQHNFRVLHQKTEGE